jgi:FKBP-type peptidyl-prolyl cis-trans isomerase
MKTWKSWIGGIAFLAMAGCGGGDGDAAVESAQSLAPEVDLSAMTESASGLFVLDLEVGEGQVAEAGQLVTVHYTGWFLGGEKFDSSVDRGEPYVFPLGGGQVIAGWDEGVAGMRVGGKRRLVIPPEMAYGPEGRPGIPPNSTLVFNVELLGVE